MGVNSSLEARGSLLARNTALNLIGQVVPLLVGVVTIPFIIRGLGTEGFGVLSLALVVLGYFGLFDLGLGRATTQYVAEHLGRGEARRLPSLVWASALLNLLLGVLGAGLLAVLTPMLVDRVFNIPPVLVGEAKRTFFYLAFSLPLVLVGAVLRGVLEAAQRFDLVNAVKIPASSLTFLIPAAALPFGLHLSEIVLLLVVVRLGAALAYLALCRRALPVLAEGFSFDPEMIRSLLTYGGWVTVSSVVGPILVYLDRILIGSLISVAAVAYYTAPYEVVTRLWILPGSLVATLFPAFSSLGQAGSQDDIERLLARSVKHLLLITGPVVMILILFSEEILQLWIGRDFAELSTTVFRVLAIGVLINSLAQVPYSFLQGFGRPDLVAKFHLAELPVHVAMVWFFVHEWGIAGAAVAWTLRVGIDALLLFGASWKLQRMSPQVLLDNGVISGVVALFLFSGVLVTIPLLNESLLAQVGFTVVLVGLFLVGAWRYVLDASDRGLFSVLIRQLAGVVRAAR